MVRARAASATAARRLLDAQWGFYTRIIINENSNLNSHLKNPKILDITSGKLYSNNPKKAIELFKDHHVKDDLISDNIFQLLNKEKKSLNEF